MPANPGSFRLPACLGSSDLSQPCLRWGRRPVLSPPKYVRRTCNRRVALGAGALSLAHTSPSRPPAPPRRRRKTRAGTASVPTGSTSPAPPRHPRAGAQPHVSWPLLSEPRGSSALGGKQLVLPRLTRAQALAVSPSVPVTPGAAGGSWVGTDASRGRGLGQSVHPTRHLPRSMLASPRLSGKGAC